MNYSGKEAGFTKGEVSIFYKEWLPGVVQAELIVNAGEIRYVMNQGENGCFDACIPFEGEMRIFEGSKVLESLLRSNSESRTRKARSTR